MPTSDKRVTAATAEVRALVTRLAQAGSAVVSDVLDECGFSTQVLDNAIRRVDGGAVAVCGPIRCVRGETRVTVQTVAPSDAFLSPYALAGAAEPGAVLVVATGVFRGGAILGGMLAADLAERGCAGLVTDGLVRDRSELEALGMMVCSAGVTPVNGARRWAITELGGSVALPGQHGGAVLIASGDYVLADGDGIVVIPRSIADEVAALAEELACREAALECERADRTLEALAEARKRRFSHIKWLRTSR
ncbi:MAG TPA: hypothetical protein PL143_05295 [Rhodocyclaceae bacterium]|nr:hypothetical protein [Rhodocyclaceae bacterium]